MKTPLIMVVFFLSFILGVHIQDLYAREKELAPDFNLWDLENNAFILTNYNNQKPVMLFFWTTWCPFCRGELKALNNRYPDLAREGWELFAIDVGEPSYRVKNFLKGYSLDFKVLLDRDTTVADVYGIFGVPTYILIDKEGYITFKGNRFPEEECFKIINNQDTITK